ncbi:hypothetical protein KB206_15880 [Microvirga sp. STS02]|uniref:hypothetical protein n=1 Tax=Hymenobacter negativus TaxID=2795026 RepID=UPI0018DBD0E6|nr:MULTISPECIES: hypothetical protein [Bacteria]MBH8570372.1 hypothetical protein [Hymenobacter negativus]MBR7210111.1 hypothetical protein [Microvirga sp. STS02]
MSSQLRPFNFLVLLLAGALALSLGLNGFLLYKTPAPTSDCEDLQETEADLRLTQRLLARCQAAHQQQDSLLALRPTISTAVPTATTTAH